MYSTQILILKSVCLEVMRTLVLLTLPPAASMILNSAIVRLLFPAPVRPHTPTFSPGRSSRSRSLSTRSSPGR